MDKMVQYGQDPYQQEVEQGATYISLQAKISEYFSLKMIV